MPNRLQRRRLLARPIPPQCRRRRHQHEMAAGPVEPNLDNYYSAPRTFRPNKRAPLRLGSGSAAQLRCYFLQLVFTSLVVQRRGECNKRRRRCCQRRLRPREGERYRALFGEYDECDAGDAGLEWEVCCVGY